MKLSPIILALSLCLAAGCASHTPEKKPAKPAANTAAKPAAKTATGTFLGIEQGDYAHWDMRSDAGKPLSFFILKADASVDKVVENPKPYIGRRCRVTWKSGLEYIPEEGGKIPVEQILSVEWLGKK